MTLFSLARAVFAGLLLCCIGTAPSATAASDPAAVPPEVEPLRQALASGESATAVLDRWCVGHGLAPAGSVRAEKLRPDSFPIPAEAGAKLRLNGRAIAARRVRLHCGATLLSEARLWFLPNLLTPEMRRRLARTRTPFGAVVAPLHFRRVQSRIAVLPAAREASSTETSGDLMSVEAYLVLPDGRAFAFTQEVYKASLLNGVAAAK
jgi:hypothetical protein